MSYDKQASFELGIERSMAVLRANDIITPSFFDVSDQRPKRGWGQFGFYRNGAVHVNVKHTRPATKTPGFSWTYPGYKSDLTAYGVVAHEVGHHVDHWRGASVTPLWRAVRDLEPAVTSYEPDLAEAFAEAFKLFVTNPDLLRAGRPRRYDYLTRYLMFMPVGMQSWRTVLADAHPRFHEAAERWIADGRRVRR